MKMEVKTKLFLFFAVSLFSLSLFSTVPSTAFTADSYSQTVGEELIWEVKLSKIQYFLWDNPKVGDRLRLLITKTNVTDQMGMLCDCVYGKVYNNSAANRTWAILLQYELLWGAYNSSVGIAPMFEILFIIPHNASAVESMMYFYSMMFMGNYTWTPGPNGYDGVGAAWEENETVVFSVKLEYKFNSRGELQYLKMYNATGTTWDLALHMELIGKGGIPGFLVSSVIFTLSIFVAIYALRLKGKLKTFK